jgi:hypothetical protein
MEANVQQEQQVCSPAFTRSGSYASAAIPDPYQILGLRLRPFSLGHYLLLQRFECGFVQDKPFPISRQDLIAGVLICSMRHSEFLEFLQQKNFLRQVRRWGKRVGFFDLAEKTTFFEAYLRASLSEPDYIELQPGGSGGEWSQNLKITLMTKLGYSEAEAIDMPLSKALADYYKLAESEGLIRLLTAEDRAAALANDAIFSSLEGSAGGPPASLGGPPSDRSTNQDPTCPA